MNANGTYTITDPAGNLLSAYEVPGFVMMIETANAGPNEDTQALITAVESVPATVNTFAATISITWDFALRPEGANTLRQPNSR